MIPGTYPFASIKKSGTSLVEIENSALFNSANSEYLSRTPSSAGNRDTWTFSAWVNTASRANNQTLFSAGSNDSNGTTLWSYSTNGALQYRHRDGGTATDNIITTPLFRDIGWYHIVFAVDTTQAVETNRVRIYVNGVAITDFSTSNYPAQNADTDVNSTVAHHIGATTAVATEVDGYIAETVLIDGLQLTPTSFGEFDETGLYWTPKSSTDIKNLTFGTNGFYLDNTTNAQTDASGEGNNFTNNNTVVTTTHTPTNIQALNNVLVRGNVTFSNGNRTMVFAGASYDTQPSTLVMPEGIGKWYCEYTNTTLATSTVYAIGDPTYSLMGTNDGGTIVDNPNGYGYIQSGNKNTNAGGASYGNSWTSGDIIGIAYDAVNGSLWFSKNGTWQASATSSEITAGTTTNAAFTGITGDKIFAAVIASTGACISHFAAEDWNYTAPTDFLALNTTNLAEATTRSEELLENHFQVALVNHDGSSTAFTQNWSNATYHTAYWIKNRDAAEEWFVMDTLRGDSKHTKWDDQEPEQTDSNVCTFDGGSTITLGSTLLANKYVVYCFRLGLVADGTSNTDGNVTTVCSANQTAGWSCLNWSGINTNPATIGHGLGGDYGLWMLKVRTVLNGAIGRWFNMGTDKNVYVYNNGSQTSDGYAKSGSDNGATGEGVFGVTGNNTGTSQSGQTYMGMVFAKNTVFLNVGTYEGNGNANGTFVPNINSDGISQQTTFTFSKSIDSTSDWAVVDNVREGYNGANDYLVIDRNIAETATNQIDLVTGGIKNRLSTDPNVAETFSYLTIGIPTIDKDGRIIAAR